LAHPRFRLLILVLFFAALPTTALAQDDIAMTLQMSGNEGGQVGDVIMTVAGDKARMEFDQAAMIFSADWMRMVQKSEQRCIEFDRAMMERMRQMMGNMPGGRDAERAREEAEDFDVSGMTFDRTGNTSTVAGHETFEVAFTDAEGNTGSMWMAADADTGLFEVMSRMLAHLESLAGPMMGGPGGRGPAGPAQNFQQYMSLARAQGLPEGRVLKLTTEDGTRIEVMGWEWGPFGDETWESEYACETMQFPGRRR
jgi:hypothetical protein